METKKENTAVGNATSLPADPYSPDQQITYHTSLALIDKLVQNGLLTQADFKRACVILTRKYGLPEDSIFAEVA
jgi:hypothetical protein